MNLLVVKTSSLGDVIHTLPAISDVRQQLPNAVIHWVVEEAFVDIPALHPAVSGVIPVAVRRWRQHWLRSMQSGEMNQFLRTLRAHSFDTVIDAQGLIKSALMTRLARGERCGFDAGSSREGAASLFYHRRFSVQRSMHAVDRVRSLFAAALGYEFTGPANFGITRRHTGSEIASVMFLHGSTWPSKLWPEENWYSLAELADREGYRILIPAGNDSERSRAHRIAAHAAAAEVLPAMSLKELAVHLAACDGVVSVDTGPGHLAAALDVPMIAFYGPTDPMLTGIRGPNQRILTSDLPCVPCVKRNCKFSVKAYSSKIYPPCYTQMTPEATWQALKLQISKASRV